MSRHRKKRLRFRHITPTDNRRVDLHMHSNLSDGKLSPDEIVELACKRKLDIICISDHDLAPVVDAAEYTQHEHTVRVIHGAEMSVSLHGEEQHFLAYFPEQMPVGFREVCTEQAKARAYRYDELRKDLALDGIVEADEPAKQGLRSLTRRHLARAVIEAGHARYISEVFERWLKDKERGDLFPSAKEMIHTIHDHGGVCLWAHPALKKVGLHIEELKKEGLDGLEVFRPHITKGDRKRLKQICSTHSMLCSGGSDSHDESIGLFSVQAGEIQGWPQTFSFHSEK